MGVFREQANKSQIGGKVSFHLKQLPKSPVLIMNFVFSSYSWMEYLIILNNGWHIVHNSPTSYYFLSLFIYFLNNAMQCRDDFLSSQ